LDKDTKRKTRLMQDTPINKPTDKREFKLEIGWAHMLGAAIGLGILGFIVALPLFYFKSGVHSIGKLLAYSACVGVFVGIVAHLRGGGKQKRVLVNTDGLIIENEKERTVLTWADIEQINHWVHGEHYWEFVTPHRARPIVLKGFGFSKQECEQLSETLRQYKTLVEETVGTKRMLEDAFVH